MKPEMGFSCILKLYVPSKKWEDLEIIQCTLTRNMNLNGEGIPVISLSFLIMVVEMCFLFLLCEYWIFYYSKEKYHALEIMESFTLKQNTECLYPSALYLLSYQIYTNNIKSFSL